MLERSTGAGVVTELLVDVHCAGCVKPVHEALRTVPGTLIRTTVTHCCPISNAHTHPRVWRIFTIRRVGSGFA
jgi:hypothetical protein